MERNIGYVPGFRRAHGRGVAFRGTFTASPEAAALTIAEHMQGDQIPVTVRLSNGDGNPYAPTRLGQKAPSSGWRSASRCRPARPPSGRALNVEVFPARKPDDFAGPAGAQKKNMPTGMPNPRACWPSSRRTRRLIAGMQGDPQGPKPSRSFATTRFNGLTRTSSSTPTARGARFATAGPVAGEPAASRPTSTRFLPAAVPPLARSSCASREEPAAWDLVFQMAEPGDPTRRHDQALARVRPLVDGRAARDRPRARGPGPRRALDVRPDEAVPPGIELSDDPVLHFRSESYIESQQRRLAESKPAITARVDLAERPRGGGTLVRHALPRHPPAPAALDAGPARPRARDAPARVRPRPAAVRAVRTPAASRSPRCPASSA